MYLENNSKKWKHAVIYVKENILANLGTFSLLFMIGVGRASRGFGKIIAKNMNAPPLKCEKYITWVS